MSDVDKLLNSIYYDTKNPASFSSENVLYKEGKKYLKTLSHKQVNNWLKSQFVHTLHKQPKRKFQRNRIIVEDIDEIFEADLVDMQEFSAENDNYKYILTVIDVMSKFGFAIPIKNKKSVEIIRAFKEIFKMRKPLCLRTDQGGEFLNRDFGKFIKSNRIYHFTSKNKDIKCAVVERFNRTLKMKMFKYFTSKGNRRYINIIGDLINNYNNSYHRTIKMTPNEASFTDREMLLKNIYGNKFFKKIKPLKIGSKVRKAYDKKPFDKGFYPNWTDQVYEVAKTSSDRVPLYKIEDEKKKIEKPRFYRDQIQDIIVGEYRVEKIIKRRIYKGKKQCFIKWLNYPNEYNSWVDESEIVTL